MQGTIPVSYTHKNATEGLAPCFFLQNIKGSIYSRRWSLMSALTFPSKLTAHASSSTAVHFTHQCAQFSFRTLLPTELCPSHDTRKTVVLYTFVCVFTYIILLCEWSNFFPLFGRFALGSDTSQNYMYICFFFLIFWIGSYYVVCASLELTMRT